MKGDEIYLNHILTRCRKIEKFTAEHTLEELFADEDLQDVLTRSLEIIGEATAHLSDDFKEVHSDIPWTQIKGMRNILIHQYFRIDLDFVWVLLFRTFQTSAKKLKLFYPKSRITLSSAHHTS